MVLSKLRALRYALVAAVLTGALLPVATAEAATALPPGFVLRDTSAGLGQEPLTDFAYLPDNSVLVIGKSGSVRWLPADGSAGRLLTKLPVRTNEDLGLVGLAVAPDYATSHAIYLTRSINQTSGFVMRLARFTVTVDAAGAPTGLDSEQSLFEVPGIFNVHGIDEVVAATDGTLWLSIGDSGDFTKMDPGALRALDVNQPYGKIFHLAADGKGVPGNPYYDAANPGSTASKVFARGFRNPFRFSIDPSLGLPVAGDVGWATWEEVDVVQRGANQGWPCWEGNHPTSGYSGLAECVGVANQPPVFEYQHGNGVMQGNSVTGGIVYNGSSYPAAYRGSYFFGDYVTHKIWTMKYDDQGRLTQAPENPPVFTDIGGPVKFAAAPNGDIVYADILSGNLRRLSYSAGNTAPVANASSTTDPATRTVTFDGSASVDYDNDPLKYDWEFGDGTTLLDAGATVSHAYAAGTEAFTARLTVRDPLGATGTTTIAVAPGNHTPEITLTTPGDTATFAVSQQVSVSATAADAEDGALPITWTTAVLHCPSEATCHSHPGVGGTGASFAAPFTEHPDSRMEFTASVTDSAGVTASKTYVAWPREHRITLVSTQPAALSIPVEGGVSTAMVAEGASFDVEAAPLAIDGVSKFTGWQGGPAAATWIVTVGTSDLTLTANYATPIDQRYNADPALQAKLGAPTAPEVTDGGVHYRAYANGRLYWSAVGGTKFVTGPVLAKYLAFGGHAKLGPPTTDTTSTPDGAGQYNHFVNNGNVGSIYYTAATGAHALYGEIRKKWAALDYERGLGYPTTDESGTPDGVGRYNHFIKGGNVGSIYYTNATGAHAIFGEIRKKWAALGYERGLGYPTTDESVTPDGIGRYNHFSLGHSIYYTVATGAHAVKGEIRKRWAALGWERSYLRYPTSDEYVVNGVYRSDFQGGYITYTLAGGAVDRRW
ncbi:PQQ-dependent sugar dehydrogenase [Amycolatopsis sp. SID8362]|uniref:PQQ-dependent sugar dehydrogenase n=1 Tax=Amycolatopsis sp. SID8362 TaxID=2690346 RepID=UPI00136C1580|nr:PQQ-dependent sugar dehydrogenase [Amycolatopsis sp. SID8362]NBH08014.1 PKD domain-containing protein [Amycolatopsis sp. SID8362]NED44708.1 PKD domain-containing protein [Amycolatopsis sp. SID8362]